MELSTLFGLEVYTDTGVYVGKINDVALDINEKKISGLAVGNLNRDVFDVEENKGIIIPHRWVVSVSDVVIIKHAPLAKRIEKKEE